MSTTTDPIADMLVRVRNAYAAGHEDVAVPHSKIAVEIANVLKREGYIRDAAVEGAPRRVLRMYLKYGQESGPAVRGIRRISKPGLRRYARSARIPRVLGGLGISILTTSAGVMTDIEARKRRIGGEVLCTVW